MESAAAARRHDGGDGAALKHSGADQHTTHVSEQALHGLNDFHQVKSAMSASSRETMKHYDGAAGAPTITDGHASEKSKKSQGGELKPAETHDAMVRDPYAAAQQRAHHERTPMDERGNHAGDKPAPNNPLHASSHVENGQVKSTTLADGGGSTTYDFDAKGKPASVTNSRENGTFVTKYGPDGHVTSKTFTDSKPGSTPEPANYSKNDRIDATTKDGKTTVTRKTGTETSTVTLDKNGNVESNSSKSPEQTFHTEYNSDGSMKSDSDVQRDKQGRVTSEGKQTPESIDRTDYDSKHNVVKTVHKDSDTTYTDQKFSDGSMMRQTVGPQGEHTVVRTPDGVQMEHSSNKKSEWSKVTNPDGSSAETTNDNYSRGYKQTDKYGNWNYYQYTKGSGTTAHYSGGPGSEIDYSGHDNQSPI